tara:strand:+ start:8043 stop:8300 length:258 start_codon:yes stop_codon:yes gene_type:complete
MSKKFGSIPTGQLAQDNNVRQAFAMTEESLSRLNKSTEGTDAVIETLKEDISGHLLAAIAGLDSNSTAANIVTALKSLSQKLKEL